MSSELTSVHLDKEPKPIQWSEKLEGHKPEAIEAEERGQKAVSETFKKIRSTLAGAIGRISRAAEHFKSTGDFTAYASDASIKTFSKVYGGPNKLAEWFGDENAHLSDMIKPDYSAIKDKTAEGVEKITAGYSKIVVELADSFDRIAVWKQSVPESLDLSGAKKAQIEVVPESSVIAETHSEEAAHQESLPESTTAQEELIYPVDAQAPQSSTWKPISFGESLARFMQDDSTGPRIDAEQVPSSPVAEVSKLETPVHSQYQEPNEREKRAKITDAQTEIDTLLGLDTSKDPVATKNNMERVAQLQMIIKHYRNAIDRNVVLSSALNGDAMPGQETNRGVA